ncbi:MAG: hypothetical protein ACOZDD_10405 [Bacteroidota bacterium]
MKKLLILAIIVGSVACALSGKLAAQDNHAPESDFFRAIRANQAESYITFGQGFGNVEPLIFEGLIAPYFLLRTSRDARFGATLSPAILLRMQAKESFPVRSPSYMPNLTFYRQLGSFVNKSISSSYLFLTLKHHSNGQFGNFYNEDGSFNTETGDFSTNLLELGLFLNRNVLPFSNTTEYFRTSVEVHPNIGRSEELNGYYSFVRWHNSFRIFRFPGYRHESIRNGQIYPPRVQTKVETTWMFGPMKNAGNFDLSGRLNLALTMAWRPAILSDVSLFVNLYSGKDYYNMQFDRKINVLRFGLQAFAFK